jgi:hypothetical protein
MESNKNKKISPEQRKAQFPADFTVLNNKLYCVYCNKIINHIEKTTVERHLKSDQHKFIKLDNNSNYFNPQGPISYQSKDKERLYDFIKMLIVSGIQFEKVNSILVWVKKEI